MRADTAGIKLYSDIRGHMLNSVTISHVDVSGFGAGIGFGAAHNGSGFANIRVTNSRLHGNLDAGLESYGPPVSGPHAAYANENLYVSHVSAFGNRGDPANVTTNSGSGIVLGSIRHAIVTHSVAYDNGGRGGARNEGPIGIWAYDATNVTFTGDVSHNNWSASKTDGGGFGLDDDTSNSTMEYDLSYDNHGPGFLLYSGPGHFLQTANVVRFNVSYRDGLGKHLLGGMAVLGSVHDATLYQNTVVLAQSGRQAALRLSGPLSGVRLLNNIFAAPDGLVVVAGKLVRRSTVLLAGNDYSAPARSWTIDWRYIVLYHSLAAWRSGTGEEIVGGRRTGLAVAPGFSGPLRGPIAGSLFTLGRHSPLRNAGLNLSRTFGLRPTPTYYSGLSYRAKSPDIGAM